MHPAPVRGTRKENCIKTAEYTVLCILRFFCTVGFFPGCTAEPRILWKRLWIDAMLMGEFKQELLRVNNKVNMEVFGQGLLSQQAYVIGDKVLIIAHNRRVQVLRQIAGIEIDKDVTDKMDRALVLRHKQLFIRRVAEDMGITVLSHLKDYDPDLEMSISVSVFEKPVEELIADLPVHRGGQSAPAE